MTTYRRVNVDGVGIFYREAGPPEAPTIVLLHGFPSSSHMYRDLIPRLADQFHLVAPDYPGFGSSDSPAADQFRYSFDHLAEVTEQFLQALGLSRFSLYVQDYGAPVGFRIATRHPDRVQALIIQNANAYLEGISPALASLQSYWEDRNEQTRGVAAGLLTPESVKSFYTQGAGHPERLSPDAWSLDQFFLNRPGSEAIQLELLYDYRTNPALYPEWQDYFRRHQPPTLVVWGKNDPFFTVAGAQAYQRDLRNIEVHLLDTGHFALEDEGDAIAAHIRRFLPAQLHDMGGR